jgi:flavin reductase (DIM6/NTAB) family NADH-FMN oxidoreductase RutF
MRRNLTEHDARRLLVPGPLVLITTAWRSQSDVMPCAWTMPLSSEPPLVGVAVHSSRHTLDMLRFSEEFALNIPGPSLMNFAQYFGSVSGKDTDKFDAAKVPTFNARKVSPVLLDCCVAWIECGVEDIIRIGDHHLVVGRVMAVSADDDAYDEQMWTLRDGAEKPLHYLGGSSYATLGQKLEARAPEPAGADEAQREADERRQEAAYEQERHGDNEPR